MSAATDEFRDYLLDTADVALPGLYAKACRAGEELLRLHQEGVIDLNRMHSSVALLTHLLGENPIEEATDGRP